MIRISSRMTPAYKGLFPYVALVPIFASAIVYATAQELFSLEFFVVVGAITAAWIVLYFFEIRPLADEVFEVENGLLVKVNGQTIRVPFSNIDDVRHSWPRTPSKISITVRDAEKVKNNRLQSIFSTIQLAATSDC